MNNKRNLLRIPLSIGITSAALIAFQLVIMQILSITQWHYFAYMVISMAMLGFGAAGTFLALFREQMKAAFDTVYPLILLLCSLSMASSTWLVGVFGDFDVFLLFFDRAQIGLMLFSYLVYCLPFFFGGLAITLAFYHEVGQIGRLYFYNMAGSGIGALTVIGFFWMMPLVLLTPLFSLLPLFGGWIIRQNRQAILSQFSSGKVSSHSQRHASGTIGKTLFLPVFAVALVVALSGFLLPVLPEPSEYKDIHASLQLPDAETVYRSSSPYGQLDVVRAPALRFAPALSLQYRGEPPVRDGLYNNGEYFGTLLGRFDPDDEHILDYTTRGLPYAIRETERVLVLNAATGNDVSHALYHEASHITAVEPHRQVNRLLTYHEPEWIDSLYQDPAVTLYGNHVRSFFAGKPGIRKDLIVAPVLGAFGGTSGVHALQEQYHLTLEAFQEMWNVLDDHGMITVTSWVDHPVRPPLKLLATWRMLLDDAGLTETGDHIAAIRSWGTITFVMSKSPFTEDERSKIREFSRKLSFDPLILADLAPEERDRYNRVEEPDMFEFVDTLMYGSVESFLDGYTFDVRPATDNRPFFSHFMTWSSIPELREIYSDDQLPYMELGFVLAAVTLIQIVLVSIVLIVLPLFRVGWKGTRRRWTFLYFFGVGTGFMFFEMVLIQKLVLYLGHPVYATAAVLAALLIFSGTGSYYSGLLSGRRMDIVRIGMTIVLLIVLYTIGLMPVLGLSMSWPLIAKALFVSILLAPPAFFMGMMFPLGLRRLSGTNESQIPWACGVDSCLSVSATALATLIALDAGFGIVMGIAAVAYGITTISALRIGSD